jgi:hypothetical protein
MTAEAATQHTQVEEAIIGKITMSAIGCKPGLVQTLPDGENELPLARLYGKLNEVRVQNDKDKGVSYTYFVGTFEAINMQDGEVFRSGKMFLPKGISELVEAAVQKNPNTAIGFAFQVNAIKANNPAKYSYKVLALKSPEAEDELKGIRDLVAKAGTVTARRLTGTQTGAGPKTLEGNAGGSRKTA